MSEEIINWIRKVSVLNDTALNEEIALINQNSIKAFVRAIGKVMPTEQDTHTLQNGSYNAHSYADTINLLSNIGEQTLASINAEVPVSPIPYPVSPHYGC